MKVKRRLLYKTIFVPILTTNIRYMKVMYVFRDEEPEIRILCSRQRLDHIAVVPSILYMVYVFVPRL